MVILQNNSVEGKYLRKSFIKILMAIIITVLVTTSVFFFLLVPEEYHLTDGGSYGYEAKLYTIHVSNPGKDLYPDAEQFISIHIFPFINLRIPTE